MRSLTIATALLAAALALSSADARREPPPNPYPGYVSEIYAEPSNWLCRPDTDDPCDSGLDATVVKANGRTSVKRFRAPKRPYPYGTHVAVVEVDAETGAVRIDRYAIAYDVGRAVNPTIVEGQLVGGLAQGLGGALLEELAYDAAGQLVAATLMDYLLPTATEMPARIDVRVLEDAPSPLNPLGLKGAGEGGCTGAGAAIANAVADALAPLGVRIDRLPLSPDVVLGAIRTARREAHA